MRSLLPVLLSLLSRIVPPPRWRIPVLVLAGVFAGLGLSVLRLSNAFSYLSDAPAVCMNCHVMATQYATWSHGDHRHVATCNDCHVPHDHFYRKYFFKAADGLRHSFIFTFRLEPQVIRIKSAGIAVVQENCIRCHETMVSEIAPARHGGEGRLCWECHRDTPHGMVNSLSATPGARLPRLEHVLPNSVLEWMGKENASEKHQ